MILNPINNNNRFSRPVKNKTKRKPMKDFVREYIEQRIRDVNSGTSNGRITLSDIFYDLRKPMQEAGWEPQGWNPIVVPVLRKDKCGHMISYHC
jgi:hypothetical protein